MCIPAAAGLRWWDKGVVVERLLHQQKYLLVFIALVIITAIEVTVSYLPFTDRTPQTIILVIGSLCKASLVMLYYMHLRDDSRWYALLVGFPLAIGVLLSLTFVL